MEISIIITNYNSGKFLSRAIRSALNQSFNKSEMEIIVTDDGSTDDSKQIISMYASKIIPIVNDKNIGLSCSCNNAVKMANGKFCVFIDSDDFVGTNMLTVEHDFLSHNKETMDAVSCDYYEVTEKETIIKRRDGMGFPIRCGTLYYTDHLIELGPYNVDVEREDIDFRQRFLQSGRYIYNIPIPYYKYTQRVDSLTKTPQGRKDE